MDESIIKPKEDFIIFKNLNLKIIQSPFQA